ncbi:hypothetical protein HJG60_009644 [Phyllostomus discolor]|uniref:Globoside alpha-1,3-N-acetylgalactosaminyltransferase 1 n=1 Tax=Phyllostomus discolor TaxID=89673 RepID=A0A834B868_9CHIR|nr:hypothetical protein HJG60_009644 [Phyllostomus discolor]
MRCRTLALGLGFCLLAGSALCVLWVYAEHWLPFYYVPYYLPCPAIFNMKLQYRGERPFQPVAGSQYPQPKLLEQRYTHFVPRFLESAERFFMQGYQVRYYVFTDDPAAIPRVPLGPGRTLGIVPIRKYPRWEEVSVPRMETISQHIAQRAYREVDYLFCVDVDMVFRNHWGPETLGDLVAAIHPSYYASPRQQFPYERRHVSTAFVADGEGDFYYGGAVFGGRVDRVYDFTRGCHMAILADKANSIMAAWQEESHLNRRFISHKPSKVLSPEYLWDDTKPRPPGLKLIRFSSLDKNSRWLRS